jgi:hypothetical protein
MTSKKDLIIAVLITFCLTATLFTIVPTKSGNGSSYDPWKDLNDDGVIDSTDLGMLGTSWATTGDPTKNVNVTNWPYIQNVNVTNWPIDETGCFRVKIVYSYIEWYYGAYMEPNENRVFTNSTAGYREVNLNIYSEGTIRVRVIRILPYGTGPQIDYFETSGWVFKSYPVKSGQIMLWVTNISGARIWVMVHCYITA